MPVSVLESTLFKDMFGTAAMRAVFDDAATVRRYVETEVALARVQGRLGVIPAEAARAIEARADASALDMALLREETEIVGYPILPLVHQLSRQCGAEGEYLHWGATTQDIMDTATVLQVREALELVDADLEALDAILDSLAAQYRDTPMAGRTHGVQALPITFGHKCAVWLDELSRHHERLKECEARVLVGMVVGAVGSQASLGEQAAEVERRTLARLGLETAPISWAPARDRFTEYALVLAMIGATLSKIGNELFNLQRNEFAEVEEAFSEGKLGSSTMPHKRNPTSAENLAGLCRPLRANATLMLEGMVQEGERDGIAWKIEWKALPECCLIAGAMLFQAKNLLAGLRVDADAMARNLDRMRGYLLSEHVMLDLSERVGKQTAHEWIYEASMHGITHKLDFAQALRQHKDLANLLGEEEILRLTDPAGYLGQCAASVDRVVQRHQAGWLQA